MSDAEIAYCAGLFEGEGCIVFTKVMGGKDKRIPYFYPCLTIVMSDREPLERFQSVFPVFRISKPYLPPNGLNKKPLYTLRSSNHDAVRGAVEAMWPWLSPRRQGQIRTVFDRVEEARLAKV